MSKIRGTTWNSVGRASARSSNRVDRSDRATKYAMPPEPSVLSSTVRPIMWLSGMKFRLIVGRVLGRLIAWPLQARHWARCGYIAPFGAPVLPEV